MQTFIITGASGSIGRHLNKYLQNDGVIDTIERRNFNSKYIRDLIINASGTVYLIHLAWPTAYSDFHSSPENTHFLKKSIEIFNAIQGLNVKIISAGSIMEAGNVRLVQDLVIPNPQNLYAESKCKLREFLEKEFPLNHIWGRVAYAVSFYDPPHRLTGSLLSSDEKEIVLHGANNYIDLIHVSDVAQAFYHCIINFHHLPSELVIGTGRVIQVAKFAEHFHRSRIVSKNSVQSISLNTNPLSLRNTGWSAKHISSTQLHEAIMEETKIE
jgi:nucleoside-diphosphate-sugar epimerase